MSSPSAEPDRLLYLAVSGQVMSELFEEPIGQLVLRNQRAQLVVFEPKEEVILRWIPQETGIDRLSSTS